MRNVILGALNVSACDIYTVLFLNVYAKLFVKMHDNQYEIKQD
jgi:hypothetical protein